MMKRRILILTMGLVLAACSGTVSDHEVKFRTQKGEEVTYRVNASSPLQDLGVPRYPGAEVDPTQLSMSKKGASVTVTELYSRDSIDKVARFYKNQFRSSSPEITESDGIVMITVKENEKDSKRVILFQDEEGPGTSIQIMKMGE